jgi:hypothetical protein
MRVATKADELKKQAGGLHKVVRLTGQGQTRDPHSFQARRHLLTKPYHSPSPFKPAC